MARPRKGDEARIEFLDHAEDSDGKPIVCVVLGRVASAKGKCYEIESWFLPDDPEANKDNRKVFSILKSTVIKASVLIQKDKLVCSTQKIV